MTIIARTVRLMAVEAIFFPDVARVDDLEMARLPPIERAVGGRRGEFGVNRHGEFTVSVFHGLLWHTSDCERAC